jgi:hypothetical protein
MFLSTLGIFRVSRSFPFISKTLDYDFVGLGTSSKIGTSQVLILFNSATQAMMWTGSIEQFAFKLPPKPQKVGVKAGVFIIEVEILKKVPDLLTKY